MAHESYLLHTDRAWREPWESAAAAAHGIRIERLETVYALYAREHALSYEQFLALDWRDLEIWKAARHGRAVAARCRERREWHGGVV